MQLYVGLNLYFISSNPLLSAGNSYKPSPPEYKDEIRSSPPQTHTHIRP